MTDDDLIDIISSKRTLVKSGHIGLTLAKEIIEIIRTDERERCNAILNEMYYRHAVGLTAYQSIRNDVIEECIEAIKNQNGCNEEEKA